MSLRTWHLSKYTSLGGPSNRVETERLILSVSGGSLCIYQGDFILKNVKLSTLRKHTSVMRFQALSVLISVPSGSFENKFRFRLRSESDLREVCEVLAQYGPLLKGSGSQGDSFSQSSGSPYSSQNSSQGSGSMFSQNSHKARSTPSQNLSGSPFHSANGSGSQRSSHHSGSNGSQNIKGSPFGSQVSSHYSDAALSQEIDNSPYSSRNSSQASGSIFSQNSSQSSSSGMSQGANHNNNYQELRPAQRNLNQEFSDFSQYSQLPESTSYPTIKAPATERSSNYFTQPVDSTFSIPPVIRHCEKFVSYSQPLPTRNGGYSPSTPSPLVDSPVKPMPPKVFTEGSTQTDDELESFLNYDTKDLLERIAEKPDLKRLVQRFSEALEDGENRALFDWAAPTRKQAAVPLERSAVSLRSEKTPQKSHPGGGDNLGMRNDAADFSPSLPNIAPSTVSLRRL